MKNLLKGDFYLVPLRKEKNPLNNEFRVQELTTWRRASYCLYIIETLKQLAMHERMSGSGNIYHIILIIKSSNSFPQYKCTRGQQTAQSMLSLSFASIQKP